MTKHSDRCKAEAEPEPDNTVIDCNGKGYLKSTPIRTLHIANRFANGFSAAAIATHYGVSLTEVEGALRSEMMRILQELAKTKSQKRVGWTQ